VTLIALLFGLMLCVALRWAAATTRKEEDAYRKMQHELSMMGRAVERES
jgi:hypothetical protein